MRSVFTSVPHLLRGILDIHAAGCRTFDLDPMYNKGSFYRIDDVLPRPMHCFDLVPLVDHVVAASADALPVRSNTMGTMVLDPPWLISKNRDCRMAQRYGAYESKADVMHWTNAFLVEGYRVLRQDGLLVFKCQDFIHDRRKFFMSLWIQCTALKIGFNLLDEVLYLPKSRLRARAPGKRAAAESWHTKFLVFRKKRSRTKYF